MEYVYMYVFTLVRFMESSINTYIHSQMTENVDILFFGRILQINLET